MSLSELFSKKDGCVTELLPFVQYEIEADCFSLKNGGYMDILCFTTKDLTSTSTDEIEYDILTYSKFYKTFADDIKIIGLNFPTDTKTQQIYIKHKIKTTTNAVFVRHLERKLYELEWIEQHRTDREYYLIIFSETIEKHRDNLAVLQKSLGQNGLISTLDQKKKQQIIFKMNNKSTSIFL